MFVQSWKVMVITGLVLGAVVLVPLGLSAQGDSSAPTTSTTLIAVQDTHIDSSYSYSWGDKQYMKVGSSNYWGIERSLIQFDISGVPASGVIERAELRVFYYVCSADCPAMDASIHRLTQSWNEATANWPSMGNASDPTIYASYTIPAGYGATGDWVKWDITNLVREWHSGSFPNNGLAIHGPEGPPENNKTFRTKEFGTGWAPQLVIEWNYPPRPYLPLVLVSQ